MYFRCRPISYEHDPHLLGLFFHPSECFECYYYYSNAYGRNLWWAICAAPWSLNCVAFAAEHNQLDICHTCLLPGQLHTSVFFCLLCQLSVSTVCGNCHYVGYVPSNIPTTMTLQIQPLVLEDIFFFPNASVSRSCKKKSTWSWSAVVLVLSVE